MALSRQTQNVEARAPDAASVRRIRFSETTTPARSSNPNAAIANENNPPGGSQSPMSLRPNILLTRHQGSGLGPARSALPPATERSNFLAVDPGRCVGLRGNDAATPHALQPGPCWTSCKPPPFCSIFPHGVRERIKCAPPVRSSGFLPSFPLLFLCQGATRQSYILVFDTGRTAHYGVHGI